ncbi:hypothetical protein KY285_033514 [Solanum tuberosum]|nr:hypothetical protein KY285_033514 [Solanum tuberosum]
MSTSKKKHVASHVSSSCSLPGSDSENLTQSNPSASSAHLDLIIHFRQQTRNSGDTQRRMAKRETHANFLDLTVMELLDIEDKNGHAIPYGFWMASIFKAFDVPVQVWVAQTVKDMLADKEHELAALTYAHQLENEIWEARVVALQNELAQERTANIATMRH